jgi:hypothetical protein
MSITTSTILVVQLLDNGLYMTATNEGELLPLRRDVDGTLHSDGELTLAPKELQWRLFKQINEELADFKENLVIFLAPLSRYMEEPCCQGDHMPNQKMVDFKKKLEESISQSHTNIKEFAFRLGYRKAKTLSTWGIVKNKGATWAGPIELTPAGYNAIAKAAMECKDESP